MTALAVWMYGRQIGSLTRSRGQLVFTYSPAALGLGIGRPLLSIGLTTRTRPYRGRGVEAFFAGLLPEGEARRMIAYDFGLESDDVFGLLAALGRDCAGALVILPEGEPLPVAGTPEPVADTEIAQRIRALRFAPLGVDQRIRVSLAGVQEKLLLARAGTRWCLPVDGAPSTHVLKPAHPLLTDSIANEGFCLRLAARAGVRVAVAKVCTFAGVEVLCVERYDRRSDATGTTIRIHQEDFCQARGLGAERKYEVTGGPSFAQCADILDQWGRGREDLEQLLDLVVVNIVIGNADAHAKNLSVLHTPEGRVELAPAYDLMSTTHYPQVSTTPGMFIGGVRDMTQVAPGNIMDEARSWGMSAGAAEDRVQSLLDRIPTAAALAARDIAPPAGLPDAVVLRAQQLRQ